MFSIVILDFWNRVNVLILLAINLEILLLHIISAPFSFTIISPIFSLFIPNFINAPKYVL